jgi:hypothetical protein
MPNQHKRSPLALRLPEGLEAWYRSEAAKRKMALNALAVEALEAYRGGNTKPRPGNTTCPHPRARIHKGLCGACGTNVG